MDLALELPVVPQLADPGDSSSDPGVGDPGRATVAALVPHLEVLLREKPLGQI